MYRNDTGKFVSNIIILKLRNVIIILEGAVSLKDAYKLSQLPRIHLIQMSHYVAKVFFFLLGFLLWKISLDISLQKKKQTTQRCGTSSSLQFVSQLTEPAGIISHIKSDIRHSPDNPEFCENWIWSNARSDIATLFTSIYWDHALCNECTSTIWAQSLLGFLLSWATVSYISEGGLWGQGVWVPIPPLAHASWTTHLNPQGPSL